MTSPITPGSPITAETVGLVKIGDWVMQIEGSYVFRVTDLDLRECPFEQCTFLGRPDADGWIKHDGGENPLPGGLVWVRLREGDGLSKEEQGSFESEQWEWPHYGGGGDITHWQPLPAPPALPAQQEG